VSVSSLITAVWCIATLGKRRHLAVLIAPSSDLQPWPTVCKELSNPFTRNAPFRARFARKARQIKQHLILIGADTKLSSSSGRVLIMSKPLCEIDKRPRITSGAKSAAYPRPAPSRSSRVTRRSSPLTFSPRPSARNRSRTPPCAPTMRSPIPRPASSPCNWCNMREPARST
jgi:hypothetical protein